MERQSAEIPCVERITVRSIRKILQTPCTVPSRRVDMRILRRVPRTVLSYDFARVI